MLLATSNLHADPTMAQLVPGAVPTVSYTDTALAAPKSWTRPFLFYTLPVNADANVAELTVKAARASSKSAALQQ